MLPACDCDAEEAGGKQDEWQDEQREWHWRAHDSKGVARQIAYAGERYQAGQPAGNRRADQAADASSSSPRLQSSEPAAKCAPTASCRSRNDRSTATCPFGALAAYCVASVLIRRDG